MKSSSSSATTTATATTSSTFCDDSDQEPPVETSRDRMLWRKDPEESKSDWTIRVVVKNTSTTTMTTTPTTTKDVKKKASGGSSSSSSSKRAHVDDCKENGLDDDDDDAVVFQIYHVHTLFLTVGPRRGEYFVRMLQDKGRFKESQTNTSTIQLDVLAAEAFPVLLDFMYSSERDEPVPFTTQNATALYSLAKYFDMRRLQYLAKQFWQVDVLQRWSCATYYEHATILQEEKVLKAATTSCQKNILKRGACSALLHAQYVQFWLDICDRDAPVMSTEYRLQLSRLMATFLHNSGPDLEHDIFLKLTSETFLPWIHIDAAVPLWEADQQRLLRTTTDNTRATMMDNGYLTPLQERCLQSIVRHWKETDLGETSDTIMLLHKQSPKILARLFSTTVDTAKTAHQELETTIGTMARANEDLLQQQLHARRSNHKSPEKYNALKRQYKSLKRKYSALSAAAANDSDTSSSSGSSSSSSSSSEDDSSSGSSSDEDLFAGMGGFSSDDDEASSDDSSL